MPIVLFVQGGGPNVHDGWDQKLVTDLERELGPAYEVRYPRMPDEANPTFATWRAALETELAAVGDDAILIGHSIGGTILVHSIGERRCKVLVLVSAPYIGDGGWPSDEIEPNGRFTFPFPTLLFHGDADATVATNHVRLYAAAIANSTVQILAHRDHQLNNDLREVARALAAFPADAV